MATWIKLYNEMLSDPKTGRMSDHLFRRTIEFFLLAGTVDQDGLLPDIEDIAWTLHTSAKDIKETIDALSKLGIVTVSGHVSCITHFAERQRSAITEAERKAAWRDKQRTKAGQMSGQIVDNQSGQCPDICPAPVPKMSGPDTDTDTDTDTELILNKLNIKNSLDIKQHKAAEAAAREKPAKKKLSPDQQEFWQRAFGPEAERAQAFSSASGIIPIGTEFGRWQKDLRAFTEAGIGIDQMIAAVKKVLREKKYPIKAPGTVFTEARNLNAAPAIANPKTTADYLDGISWEGCDE